MVIRDVELTNFRSYERAVFEFHPVVTLIVGPNASGKTNLLESLFVLASTKSFRARDRELVRHGEDHFRLVARSDAQELAYGFSMVGGTIERRASHDGVRRALVAHIGYLPVTLFEPTDLELLSGPPEGRRRYLDFILCQTDRVYLKTLQNYRRVLKQRNALLSPDASPQIREQLFGWNIQLTELATEIYHQRSQLIDELNRRIPAIYADIAGIQEDLELIYQPSVTGDYEPAFLAALERNLARDLGAGFTTIGPHREDFEVRFKNKQLGSVASRGEARTVVLACKLAELAYAEALTESPPLLLLDDVFSELDVTRRAYLVSRLGGYQTIITTTNADAVTSEIQADYSLITMDGVRV